MSGYMADQTNNYQVYQPTLWDEPKGDRGLDNTAVLSRKKDSSTSKQAAERKKKTLSAELDLIQTGINLFVTAYGKNYGFTAKELAKYIGNMSVFIPLKQNGYSIYTIIQKRLSVIADKRGTIYKPEKDLIRKRDGAEVWEIV